MKRKILFLLSALTISSTLLSACKASDSVDNSAVKSEATEITVAESEATETVAETETGTESTVAENTEATEEVETTEIIESTDIAKGEPLSEKDLAFSFLGYDTYNEYVEAGNDGAVYILADNANMIVSGQFKDEGNVLESTVRSIKLGDSIDKVFELYGDTEYHSTDIKDEFSHDELDDCGAYNYFLKLDSTKKYFYAFRFRVDQNDNIIAVVIEPIPMKYWSDDLT